MIELQLTHTQSASELVVGLDIRNKTSEHVYIPILPVDADFATYPNSAYAHLTNDDTAVCLLLGPSLLPTLSKVEMQMSAYCTLLEPGGRVRHTLRFPLPLSEWNAYYVPESDLE